MKKYVVFTLSIVGVGGGQLYVSNKLKYMEESGYETYVFSALSGEILVSYLKETKGIIDNRFNHYPSEFPKKRVSAILDQIVRILNYSENDEMLVESTCINLSLWAELLAQKCNAKHILFSISEKNEVFPGNVDYYVFKYKRRELFTINSNTFSELYKKSSMVSEGTIPVLVAYLGIPVENYECRAIDEIDKKDRTICILGRISKKYVEIAARELAHFCSAHASLTFNIIVVGGVQSKTDEEIINNIYSYYADVNNATLYYPGGLSPLPEKLFEICDLFIGGAGCAILPYRKGKLTLGMSVIDGNALGLMGYDTSSTFIPAQGNISIQQFFSDALIDYKYKAMNFTPAEYSFSSEEIFDSHIREFNKSLNDKEYFSTFDIKLPIKKRIGAILLHYLGEEKMRFLFRMKQKGTDEQ